MPQLVVATVLPSAFPLPIAPTPLPRHTSKCTRQFSIRNGKRSISKVLHELQLEVEDFATSPGELIFLIEKGNSYAANQSIDGGGDWGVYRQTGKRTQYN